MPDPSGGEGRVLKAGRSVLLVDDNEDDRMLARLAARRIAPATEIHEVTCGFEALEWLRGAPLRPALILLDLKMPRLDGAGVLSARLEDARLRCIPVAVFTTSRAPEDVERSYSLGANVYVLKPTTADELEEVLNDLFRVYLRHAELPQD